MRNSPRAGKCGPASKEWDLRGQRGVRDVDAPQGPLVLPKTPWSSPGYRGAWGVSVGHTGATHQELIQHTEQV